MAPTLILETQKIDTLQTLTAEEIVSVLDSHHISRETWGKGNNRSLENLIDYMQQDQVSFRVPANGHEPLILDVCVAQVTVKHFHRRFLFRRWWELYESVQETPDTELTPRKFPGIAETLKKGESGYRDGAVRCLQEELGWEDPSLYSLSPYVSFKSSEPEPSDKWPGLWAVYNRYKHVCIPSKVLFKPQGYQLRERSRLHVFKWKLFRR